MNLLPSQRAGQSNHPSAADHNVIVFLAMQLGCSRTRFLATDGRWGGMPGSLHRSKLVDQDRSHLTMAVLIGFPTILELFHKNRYHEIQRYRKLCDPPTHRREASRRAKEASLIQSEMTALG
jgi:hypothetical protein